MLKDSNQYTSEPDDFDLDLDLDLDDDVVDADAGNDEDSKAQWKQRMSAKIQKRVAKERAKYDSLKQQIEDVYGMTPEEVIQYGERQRQQLRAAPQGATRPIQTQSPQWRAPKDIPSTPIGFDPVARAQVAKLNQAFAAREEAIQQRDLHEQQQREAQEFVSMYPNVMFKDIPKEALDRRSRGGVTLTEAYRLVTSEQQVRDAMRKGAQGALRDVERNRTLGTEGPDASAGISDAAGSLTPEEREFAASYGMTPKEYVVYKRKAAKKPPDESF